MYGYTNTIKYVCILISSNLLNTYQALNIMIKLFWQDFDLDSNFKGKFNLSANNFYRKI